MIAERQEAVLPSNLPDQGVKDVANLSPFERTIAFLKTAIAEDAHLRKPKRITEESWVRTRNIIGVYFGSPITEERLGKGYGYLFPKHGLEEGENDITRESIRQLVKRGICYLWQNCSKETQASFPLTEIVLAKPWAKKSKGRISRTLEGRQLARELANATDKAEIQELLKRVKYSFYRRYTQGEKPLLIKFRTLIAGFYPTVRDYHLFLRVLQDSGITVYNIKREVGSGSNKGTQRFYFIAAQNQQEAREILLASPKLARFLENPVRQFAGPTGSDEPLPTTWQLVNKQGGFISVGRIMAEFAVRFDSFLEGCPVAIFQYRDRYFFRRDQAAVLQEFIARKMEELR